MTKTQIAEVALGPPEPDRLELAETLWASIHLDSRDSNRNLPDWQKELLDSRLESSAGETGESWQEVRAAGRPAMNGRAALDSAP